MKCANCQLELSDSSFYATNKTRCKECVKARVKQHRLENSDHFKDYERSRSQLPHRVDARKTYASTASYAASHKASVSRWKEQHADRREAQNKLNNAVRDGVVQPWPICAVPCCDRKPEAHHPDYDKPLSVVWLCTKHHRQSHQIK